MTKKTNNNDNTYNKKVQIKVLYGTSNFKRRIKTWDNHQQLKKRLEDATHHYANKSIELELLMKSSEGMYDKTVTAMKYITGMISDDKFNNNTQNIKQASLDSAHSLNSLIKVVAECSESGMDGKLVYQTRMDVFRQHGMKV